MPRTTRKAKSDPVANEVDAMIEVTSQEQIPEFGSEEELDAFWSTHEAGEAYLDHSGLARRPRGPSPRVRRVLGLPPS